MKSLLSFEIRQRSGGAAMIVPCIDGASLIEMVKSFDRRRDYNRRLRLSGLVPEYFRYGSLDRYFRGLSPKVWTPVAGKICVLACECGEIGCLALTCTATENTDGLQWRDFEPSYPRGRDYSAFGSFTFDKDQFAEALRSLPTFGSAAISQVRH